MFLIPTHPNERRFPDMATEWMALWIHFLWSSILTMAFSMSAWWKIGVAIAPMAKYQQDSEAGKETMKKRRRLLQIGFMVSVCLLLNMIATLATSTTSIL
jgi:hypothetical protein